MTGVAVKFRFTSFTIQSFGVVFTNALSCGHITKAPRFISVIVTVTPATSLSGCCITVASRFTSLAEFTFSPVLAFVTSTDATFTRRMIMASAINRAVGTGPPEVAVTFILRSTQTVPVNAVIVTRLDAAFFAVAYITLFTFACVRPVRVGTICMLVTVVEAEAAFVDVRTLRIRPPRILRGHVQQQSAIVMRFSEIALSTSAVYRVLKRVTPSATHTTQTRRTLSVASTRFALAGFSHGFFGRNGGPVEPLPTQAELIFTGVDTEAEALMSGLAPDAAAALVETVLAVEAHAARRRTVCGVQHGAGGPAAPRAASLVRPPLAVRAGHAALAAYVIGTVWTSGRQQCEIPPLAVHDAHRFLVSISGFTSVRQFAPTASGIR